MADPSDLNNRASPLQSWEGNQNRQEPLIQENRATLDNLPAEIRMNIMRQTMRGAPDLEIQAEAFCTANALRQASPNYRQTLVSNPTTLGAEFQQLARDTVHVRAYIAVNEVGGPGDERTADNVIARRGPLRNAESDRVRKVGVLRDVQDYATNVSDAIARHRVTHPEDQAALMRAGAFRSTAGQKTAPT